MRWLDFLRDPAIKEQARMRALCEGRERFSDADYYHRFFPDSDVAEHTVTEVRSLFAHTLGDIFYLIYPDDDWSKEFRPLWDLDSMANVELVVAMEEIFDITIPEAEASSMTTLRKTVEAVTARLAEKSR